MTEQREASKWAVAHYLCQKGVTLTTILDPNAGSQSLEAKPHYVLLERDYSENLAIRYPSRTAAEDAMLRSEYINDLCESDCLGASVAATYTSDYTLVYSPEFPDPKPDVALTAISQDVLEEFGQEHLSAVVGPGQYLQLAHAGQARAFSLAARVPGRVPQWLWSEQSTTTEAHPSTYGAGDLTEAKYALRSWATRQSAAQRLRDMNAAMQPPGQALAPPPPSTSMGPTL